MVYMVVQYYRSTLVVGVEALALTSIPSGTETIFTVKYMLVLILRTWKRTPIFLQQLLADSCLFFLI
jgi:hypothetical protein